MDEPQAGTCPGSGATPRDGEEVDERAADGARARYRTSGLAPLGPLATDARLASLLAPGERVYAVREGVEAERRPLDHGGPEPASTVGPLLLTSRRIVVVGDTVIEAALEEIDEAVVSGDQLLLVLRHGMGLSLTMDRPRLLRVQVAAARIVTAGRRTGDPGGDVGR